MGNAFLVKSGKNINMKLPMIVIKLNTQGFEVSKISFIIHIRLL